MINIMNNKNGHNIVNNIMNDMLSVVQKIWFCFHFFDLLYRKQNYLHIHIEQRSHNNERSALHWFI